MVKFNINKDKIVIIGLGYVGLPMAILFSKKYKVIGFDIKKERILELRKGIDRNGEIERKEILSSGILFIDNEKMIADAKVIIVTVPTPVDKYNNPYIKPLISASEIVGTNIKKGSVVVYESTVYPGLTEEICIPIIEKKSGLKWKKDFWVGYSPERVNPGDREHTIDKIKKVVAGDTPQTLEFLSKLYGSVISAGIYKAPNIKTAEAAKVIENTQRDLNIALINELSIIFHKMGLDTKEVLEAASTKWNFLKFEPGLVGGHCIGVDPYYLTYKAQSLGYHPEVILSGRRINDNMGKYVAHNTVKLLTKYKKKLDNIKVLILGLTFKENIRDIRNTKVIDIYSELKEWGINVEIYDPLVDEKDVKKEYGIDLLKDVKKSQRYDAVIFAVKHKKLIDNFNLEKIISISKKPVIFIDVKGIFNKNEAERKNIIYWRL